ncbi:hypothetical protein BU15DRAFT_75587 [Melanogaster broomeanus]|nr:hypothetical protein BU15DRAFT_75587 [Melanogaster broomeanus]
MPTTFTNHLTINSLNLGTSATLMFTFDKQNHPLYAGEFPVCWKVIRFPATGQCSAKMTFQSQYVYAKPDVDANRIVGNSAYVPLSVGDTTTLSKSDAGVYDFSKPTKGVGGHMQAVNACPSSESLALAYSGMPPGGGANLAC